MSVGTTTSSSFPEPTPFVPRRFTVEEYRRMAEADVLNEDDRVELLEGWITPKMTHNPPHDAALMFLEESIRALLQSGWSIRTQCSITTTDSEPEPDIAVVRGGARDYKHRHPNASDLGLVVEIAESSLARDRRKARLYARAGVPEYWIVNLLESQIEVYREPTGPCDQPLFKQIAIYKRGDCVPVKCDGLAPAALQTDALLP